ncbi:MAG: penicillin-binding protein 2 [Clostridia bacterium]|nr:penicillin-binding protein 2 [Clostridia bacterium]
MKNQQKFRRNMRFSMGFFIVLFVVLIAYMGYSVLKNGAAWYATPYNPRIANARENLHGGTIYDRNGIALAWSDGTTRKYHNVKEIRRACSHVVGDIHGKTVGAETVFAKYLYGLDTNVVTMMEQLLNGEETDGKGQNVTLTIDAKLSEYIYRNMKGRRGSVVVLNYKTGEILASVSILTFDPNTVADDELEDTTLLDRATMGRYAPGSIMKIITASAAVEHDLDLTYTCTGSDVIGGQSVTCTKVHGEQDLNTAFANSCNTYFARLSTELGGSVLKKQAEKFGFNQTFEYSDVTLYRSKFEVSSEQGDVAWAGIGQYNDLVTPMHAALIAATVANDGIMPEPTLLRAVDGTAPFRLKKDSRVLSPDAAARMRDMMAEVVQYGTGTSAAVKGEVVYGKTGTAEYTENGEIKNHSWFVGFMGEEHPYAVAVLFEGAGYGSAHAAPMAAEVFEYLLD